MVHTHAIACGTEDKSCQPGDTARPMGLLYRVRISGAIKYYCHLQSLENILSNPTADAGQAGAGCPGPFTVGFLVSPQMDTPQPLWENYSSV